MYPAAHIREVSYMQFLQTFAGLFANFGNLTWQMVVMWVIGGLLMVIPGTVTDLAGLAVLVVVLVLQRIENKKDKAAASV